MVTGNSKTHHSNKTTEHRGENAKNEKNSNATQINRRCIWTLPQIAVSSIFWQNEWAIHSTFQSQTTPNHQLMVVTMNGWRRGKIIHLYQNI